MRKSSREIVVVIMMVLFSFVFLRSLKKFNLSRNWIGCI